MSQDTIECNKPDLLIELLGFNNSVALFHYHFPVHEMKFEFTEPNQILEFIFIYTSKQKLKNLLVQTNFYWSWAGGPVLIVRTDFLPNKKFLKWQQNKC